MNTVPLGDIITDAGAKAITKFLEEHAAGKFKEQHYLDVHARLRDLIRPHLKKPEDWDIDYLVYAIAYQFKIV